jgi:hypothetical protein
MNTIVGEALETAEAAGYRIDALLKSSADEDPSPEVSPAEPQPNPEPTPTSAPKSAPSKAKQREAQKIGIVEVPTPDTKK